MRLSFSFVFLGYRVIWLILLCFKFLSLCYGQKVLYMGSIPLVTMEKRFGIVVVIILLVSIFALSVLAARLPSAGGDNNAWGDVLNTYLQVAHDASGQIQSNYITSAMIVDSGITTGDIANNTILGDDIATKAALNITSLSIGVGAGSGAGNPINSSSNYTTNVTGMFIARAQLDLPSIAASACAMANITMEGLPADSLCVPIMSEIFVGGFGAGVLAWQNVTVTGLNSSINFCRLAVCNDNQTAAVNPPVMTYTVLAITR